MSRSPASSVDICMKKRSLILAHLLGGLKIRRQSLPNYGYRIRGFFLYFNEFFLLCITLFYTLTYEYVGKIQKRKRKLNIYISQTHTQLHTDKKERKKHTPVTSSLFT